MKKKWRNPKDCIEYYCENKNCPVMFVLEPEKKEVLAKEKQK